MKLFKIFIWKWQEKLHEGVYQFNTQEEAENYANGIYKGYTLAGSEPTGYATREVDKDYYTNDKYSVYSGKTKVATLLVDEGSELDILCILQGMNREETLKKIINDCDVEFTSKFDHNRRVAIRSTL